MEQIVARIIGVLLLLVWVVFLPVGRHWSCRLGGLMYATVFQWHVLPFIVGIGLVLSGNLLAVLFLPVAWVLSRHFPNFFMFVFPLIAGWVHGGLIASYFETDSRLIYYGLCMAGVLMMFIFCSVVAAIVVGARR